MPSPRPAIPSGRTDAELVGDTLAGNRDAFAEIVSRYQTLICSLAYSATGDLARSEDLAQDTFLAVWRQLPQLREREKLRAWICGIARNRINDSFRSQTREPIYRAETLDRADEATAPEAQPSDQAVSQDETAIMWRALEQIPETYREPLILFHRESQSVARVAAALDLSEEVVRQRLVRGRKLLQAEVEAVVEGALRRTAPGRTFTSSVMDALPVAGPAAKAGAMAAKAAAVGAATATKGAVGGGLFAVLSAIITSPLAPISILFFQRKLGLAREANTASANERELMKKQRRENAGFLLAAIVMLTLFKSWLKHQTRMPWFAPLLPLVTVVPLLLFSVARVARARKPLRQIWVTAGTAYPQRSWEFRSQQTLWGWPLLHIRIGFDPRWQAAAEPVKAWIAVGSAAYGVIFACGSIAIAPLCFGLFGLGFISVGLFSIGGLALGFLAIGLLAFGGGAIGWLASGAVAVGAQAAYGFSAYARTFAGIPTKHGKMPGAFALHANDLVAREFFARSRFFSLTGDCVHLVHEFPPRWSEGLGAACLLGVVFLMYEDFRRHRRAS